MPFQNSHKNCQLFKPASLLNLFNIFHTQTDPTGHRDSGIALVFLPVSGIRDLRSSGMFDLFNITRNFLSVQFSGSVYFDRSTVGLDSSSVTPGVYHEAGCWVGEDNNHS